MPYRSSTSTPRAGTTTGCSSGPSSVSSGGCGRSTRSPNERERVDFLSMSVEAFQLEFAEPFDQFLLTHPSSLFYSSSKYRQFLLDLLGCRDESLVAVDGGVIRGVLPLLSMRGEKGRVYNSLPYFGSNGGIVAD